MTSLFENCSDIVVSFWLKKGFDCISRVKLILEPLLSSKLLLLTDIFGIVALAVVILEVLHVGRRVHTTFCGNLPDARFRWSASPRAFAVCFGVEPIPDL